MGEREQRDDFGSRQMIGQASPLEVYHYSHTWAAVVLNHVYRETERRIKMRYGLEH